MGSRSFVAVKGITTFNTEEVANEVPLKKRQCQVERDMEQKLKYFSNYSQSACIVECSTHLIQEKCNCRPYFFRGINVTLNVTAGISLNIIFPLW